MWQTQHIIAQLQQAWPGLDCQVEPFVTKGDKTLDQPLPQIGGKGLFTLGTGKGAPGRPYPSRRPFAERPAC